MPLALASAQGLPLLQAPQSLLSSLSSTLLLPSALSTRFNSSSYINTGSNGFCQRVVQQPKYYLIAQSGRQDQVRILATKFLFFLYVVFRILVFPNLLVLFAFQSPQQLLWQSLQVLSRLYSCILWERQGAVCPLYLMQNPNIYICF